MTRFVAFIVAAILAGAAASLSTCELFLRIAYEDASPKWRDVVLVGHVAYMGAIGSMVGGFLGASKHVGFRRLVNLSFGVLLLVLALCGAGEASGGETLLTLAVTMPSLFLALYSGSTIQRARLRYESRRGGDSQRSGLSKRSV